MIKEFFKFLRLIFISTLAVSFIELCVALQRMTKAPQSVQWILTGIAVIIGASLISSLKEYFKSKP